MINQNNSLRGFVPIPSKSALDFIIGDDVIYSGASAMGLLNIESFKSTYPFTSP